MMALSLLLATTASAQKSAQKPVAPVKKEPVAVHRIIMQLSTADTLEHKGLMNNLKHLEEGWGDSVLIEVVVHGPGLEMLMKGMATQEAAIQMMIGKGVQLLVCRNTMKQ
jgi:intracellular sulfur oxidation DsrE/DsrF family protein